MKWNCPVYFRKFSIHDPQSLQWPNNWPHIFANALKERNTEGKVLCPVEKHCLYKLNDKSLGIHTHTFPQLQFNLLNDQPPEDKRPVKVITHVLINQSPSPVYNTINKHHTSPKHPSLTNTMAELFKGIFILKSF